MATDLWHDVDPGTADAMHVIIETPKGSHNKYEIDKDTGLIKLDRANYNSSPYPFEYGFVPQTLWDDGDALDVMLLATYPLFPGALVVARPVALMEMTDTGDQDNKIVAVPVDDQRWDDIKDVADLNQHSLKEFKHFFESIKLLRHKPGAVIVHGFKPMDEAKTAFKHGRELYKQKYGAGK